MEQNYNNKLKRIQEYIANENYIDAEKGLYEILYDSKDSKEHEQAHKLLLRLIDSEKEKPTSLNKIDGEVLSLISIIKPELDIESEI